MFLNPEKKHAKLILKYLQIIHRSNYQRNIVLFIHTQLTILYLAH